MSIVRKNVISQILQSLYNFISILVEEFEEDSGPKDFRVNCPECGKEMNRRSITRHCKDVHGSDFTTGDLVPEDGGFKGKRVICPGKCLLSGFNIVL